jgi:toxin YoeB
LSSKKKKPDTHNEENELSGYFPVFSPDFKADLA